MAGRVLRSGAAQGKPISNELLIHADEYDQASRAVGAAASEVESIKSEWGRLQRMADHDGIVINTATRDLEYYGYDDPDDMAEMLRRGEIVANLIEDLRKSNATDTRLSDAVDDAISETADALGDELPSILEAERNNNQTEAFREILGHTPVTDSDWLTAAALDPHSYDPKNPQSLQFDVKPPSDPTATPLAPSLSTVPPGNFTALGPASDAPTIRNYTPLQGNEFAPLP